MARCPPPSFVPKQHASAQGEEVRQCLCLARRWSPIMAAERGSCPMPTPATLLDKIWAAHAIEARADGATLLSIDRHLVHDGSSTAFRSLKERGLAVRRPDRTFATPDHYVSTLGRSLTAINDPNRRGMVEDLEANTRRSGVTLFGLCRPAAGDRARGRPRAGPEPAGHGDRLRRQPHGDARCGRRARLRRRRQRGHARAGNPEPVADEAQEHAHHCRRRAGARRARQGRDPGDHRQDQRRRRRRATCSNTPAPPSAT